MDTKDLDIVYVIKDAAYNDELRYSVRSVEKYLPHHTLWFYGGKPCGVHPDKQAILRQKERTKYAKVGNMLRLIAKNDEITDDFVLMNDDFFCLAPVTNLPYYYDEDIHSLVEKIVENFGSISAYTVRLERTEAMLKEKHKETKNFELHVPIVLNRKKLLDLYGDNVDWPYATRSSYCNLNGVKGVPMKDNKIVSLNEFPDVSAQFCSTSDRSFEKGVVGDYIRALFPKKSRYEL